MPSAWGDDCPSATQTNGNVVTTQIPVIIVGAGPVGLLLALRLAQSGIQSVVLEKLSSLNNAPRAIGYYGPVHKVFQEIGLYDRIACDGMPCGGYVWRTLPIEEKEDIQGETDKPRRTKRLGDILGTNNMGRRNEEGQFEPGNYTIQLAQSKLSKLMLDAAAETGLSETLWNHEVLAIEQDASGVTVAVRHLGETKKLHGRFLVGCDGGRSTVRKLLNISFSGHSWPERFLATDVVRTAPVVADPPVHFVVDPKYWAVVTPLEPVEAGKPGLWRYSMAVPALPDDDDTKAGNQPLTDEQVVEPEYVRSLLKRQIDGPADQEFTLVNFSLYKMHQLVASTMRRGNCFLAGDSAHINNPIGGLGLCTGLLDADALHQTLEIAFSLPHASEIAQTNGVHSPYKPIPAIAKAENANAGMVVDLDSLFTRYSMERRRVFQNIIHPFSSANKMRLHSGRPEDIGREDWYLLALQRKDAEELKSIHSPLHEQWRTDMWRFQSTWLLKKGLRI